MTGNDDVVPAFKAEALTSVEICAGAGGQALGLEQAGFDHRAAVEIDPDAVETLRANRPSWNVLAEDVLTFDIEPYAENLDLFAGGVPCPPFSIAGKQLGKDDERDLFPRALQLVRIARPRAVMLENVRGMAQPRFEAYRAELIEELNDMGYTVFWELVIAADYGVPQLRPRFIMVALQHEYAEYFAWPEPVSHRTTVGEALHHLMASRGWPGATAWAAGAQDIAPTLVGGSKKHGGPDVGPSRARAAWKKLGVKGSSIAEEAPGADFTEDPNEDMPRLTVQMGGVIQGFPEEWKWMGRKTAAWRQVGNAFPPPVARAIGDRIASALNKEPIPDGSVPAFPYGAAQLLEMTI